MKKPLSNQTNINTNNIKTNKDIEIPMNSNIDPKKCDDNLFFVISSDSKNDSNEYDNIDYYIEDLQLIKSR
jgi:hypothetical protein